jgi:hypothetical protein
LDYFIWDIYERDVNKTPHKNLDSLRAKITAVMTNMGNAVVAKPCSRFRPRIENVIQVSGNFIE